MGVSIPARAKRAAFLVSTLSIIGVVAQFHGQGATRVAITIVCVVALVFPAVYFVEKWNLEKRSARR